MTGLFNKVVIARIALTLVVVTPMFLAFFGYQYSKEKQQRTAAVAKAQRSIDQQQYDIAVEQHDLAVQQRRLVQLSNAVKLSSCQESNRRAAEAIDLAFRRDLALAANARKVGVSQAVSFAFVAADMRLVKMANPTLDCSPAVLGLQPVPPVPPPVAITPPESVPKADGAGTPTTRRQLAATTSSAPPRRHGQQRRPPHPVHP